MISVAYPCDGCGHVKNNHNTFTNTDKEICWCGCQKFRIDNLKYLEQIYITRLQTNG
jgi:hypothetical protein